MKDFIEKSEYVDTIYKNEKLLFNKKSDIGQDIKVYNNKFFVIF